jgi:hypothetical protein
MIEETRSMVVTAVNAGLTMLYWNIGRRIREETFEVGGRSMGRKLSLHWGENCQLNMGMDFQLKTCVG